MKPHHIFILIVLMFLTSSCVYYPYLLDVPLINERWDTRIEGGVTIPTPSAHITVSHGLTDKVAIQAAGSVGVDDSYYTQVASGIFKSLPNRKVMELYGGFGYGYGDAYNDAKPGNLYGNYQVCFAQFNYGKINGNFKNIDYGIGIKAGYLHTNMTDRNYYDYYSDYSSYNIYKDDCLLIEPVCFLRFGGKRLKFQTMAGGCFIIKFTNTDKYFPYNHFNLGFGMSYSLGGKIK